MAKVGPAYHKRAELEKKQFRDQNIVRWSKNLSLIERGYFSGNR